MPRIWCVSRSRFTAFPHILCPMGSRHVQQNACPERKTLSLGVVRRMIQTAQRNLWREMMHTLLLWIGLQNLGHATQVRFDQYPCPLAADDVVRVYTLLSTDVRGGYDSDLAQYSSDGQFRTYAVATCEQSLFSLRAEDMRRPLPETHIDALQDALEDVIATDVANPQAPMVWERYAIAAHMYQLLDAPALDIAELYLHASWTARDMVVGFHAGLNGPQDVNALLEAGHAELERPLSTDDRRTVLYSLARVAHRGGHGEQRDALLETFEALAPLQPDEQRVLDEFRHIAHHIEPRYQDLAIVWLKKGLAEPDLTEAQRIQATYLLGDLLRRRGHPQQAVAQYRTVSTHPDASDLLREMAASLLEGLGG